MGRIPGFLIFLLAVPSAVRAEALQPWPSVLVVGPLGGGWQASGEMIRRVGRTSTFNPQHEYRAQLGRTIAPGVVLWGGYVRFDTYAAVAAPVHEDQVIEQLNWTGIVIAGARLSSRTRLEQRFVHGVDQTAWRVREQLRLTAPVIRKVSAVAWAEPFVALSHTPASPRRLDQFRMFAGLGMPIGHKMDIELGYLHQILHRPAGTFVNHAIPLILNVRL